MIVELIKPEKVNKYYNDSFKEFIKNNQNKRFYVMREDENSVLLKGLYFWITKDNIRKICD